MTTSYATAHVVTMTVGRILSGRVEVTISRSHDIPAWLTSMDFFLVGGGAGGLFHRHYGNGMTGKGGGGGELKLAADDSRRIYSGGHNGGDGAIRVTSISSNTQKGAGGARGSTISSQGKVYVHDDGISGIVIFRWDMTA